MVGRILVEADLMGHTTHGLQLMAPYLASALNGGMATSGDIDIMNQRPVAEMWDGKYLPGPWLVERALETAAKMAEDYGTGTVVIRRCHHIACLAAYLYPIGKRDLVALLISSSPDSRTVAPHGGTTPVYSPNPIAACWPTEDEPVILDVSMSTTANGLCNRLKARGERLPGEWVKDANGVVGDDPAVVFTDPPGSILPLGGADAGHKGYALGIMVEALTSGLAGFGRADGIDKWGASVFVQVQDPEAFGGAAAMKRENSWLADACRASGVAPGDAPTRLPGEGGLARRATALKEGVELFPGLTDSLNKWSQQLGVDMPSPLAP